MPPTNTSSGASDSSSYNELLSTHWASPVLLSLWCFLKLFPLAEIPFTWYLLREVIFILQDPFYSSPPLGNLPSSLHQNLSLNPMFPEDIEYIMAFITVFLTPIQSFTYYVSAYLSRGGGVGISCSVGKIQHTDCFVSSVLGEHSHVHSITHHLRLCTVTSDLRSSDRDKWSPKPKMFTIRSLGVCQPLN